MVNKHEIMREYLERYPSLGAYLKFNTIDDVQGERSIATTYGDAWEKKYMRGHGIKRYDFAMIIMQPFDSGTSSINTFEMFDVQQFMEWIDEQNEAKNFPDFGEGTKIISIENLQNMPNLAGVNQGGAVAKYMFQCRVRYSV